MGRQLGRGKNVLARERIGVTKRRLRLVMGIMMLHLSDSDSDSDDDDFFDAAVFQVLGQAHEQHTLFMEKPLRSKGPATYSFDRIAHEWPAGSNKCNEHFRST